MPPISQRSLKNFSKLNKVLVPFKNNPFESNITISPLNTVPKSANKRRVILDLSFPTYHSVNDIIPKYTYLGEAFDLKYPTIDDLVQLVKVMGQGCLLFKADLKRAYRQIPIDPGDMNLLGYKWHKHIYFDRVLPMGMRSSAMICQRVTNSVRHIVNKHNVDVVDYLDDFGGADTPDKA